MYVCIYIYIYRQYTHTHAHTHFYKNITVVNTVSDSMISAIMCNDPWNGVH